MRKTILVLLTILAVSILALTGCKSEKPAPDANDQKAQQTQSPQQGNPEAEKAALRCAQAWLVLVDAEKYPESWDEGSELFRSGVPKEIWQSSLQARRKPLGKMVSRKLKSKQYTTTAPGAPDGQYVIIQYDTSFEKKISAVETITPTLDRDGKWRVSGYFIK